MKKENIIIATDCASDRRSATFTLSDIGVAVSCKIPILATRVRLPDVAEKVFRLEVIISNRVSDSFFLNLNIRCPRGLMDKASVS